MYGRWNKDPNLRALPEDYPCDVSESENPVVMYNAVGGGSIHFGAQWPRHLPSDFRVRTLDGVADDWPITYEDLVPYYEQNDIDFSVSGMAGDPAYPPGADPPSPALPINEYGRKVALGLNKLGWSWWPAPNAIASRPGNGLVPCVRYGVCESGCPNGSKASTDITHWPTALAQGATLITGARVREITIGSNGLADGAVFLDVDGTEHKIRAGVVVLAANGVGTARLMLLSTSARFPDGIANSSGLVGRNLMLHPTALAVGVYDELLESWRGPAGQNIHSYQFYETDRSRGFVRGAKWVTFATGGPLVASSLVPSHDGVGAWGATVLDDVQRVLGRSVAIGAISEDLPSLDNRVILDDSLTDSHGIPAPKIIYRRDANNIAMLDWHLARITEALKASGALIVYTHPVMADQPGHLLGTARMGTDRQRSVVDPFGRCHDVPNLIIADGSVFVTSGGVNPTNTICALALRSATELVRTRAQMETSA
jgi:choline dehydrogenase-like flavoprotein